MKTISYSYVRFSSGKQSDGSSVERQTKLAKQIADEKGWQLVDLPPDRGLSGFTGANKIKGTLGAFLRRVETGDIPKHSVLIIEKMDRFSRNEVDLVIPDFLKLLQAGVSIYSCVDNTHYTLADIRKNTMLINYAVMAISMANDFSKSLSNRVKKAFDSKLNKATNGEKVNMGGWQPRWITDNKLNERAKVVQRIVNEYLEGKPLHKIVADLNADKSPRLKHATKWSSPSVHALLRSEQLTGDLTINGKTFHGYYPAVITDKQRQLINIKLNENKFRKGRNTNDEYISNVFKNRIRCSKCGGTCTTAHRRQKHKYWVFCWNTRQGLCDCKSFVDLSSLEENFFINPLQNDPRALVDAKKDDKSIELQSQLLAIDRKIADAAKLVGLVDLEQLRDQLQTLKKEREMVSTSLSELNQYNQVNDDLPAILDDIRKLTNTVKQPTVADLEDGADDKLASAYQRIFQTLEDNNIRKAILNKMPSIVDKILLNTEKKSYQVVWANGQKSEVYKLVY